MLERINKRVKCKGKDILLQAWTGHRGQETEAPKISRQSAHEDGKVNIRPRIAVPMDIVMLFPGIQAKSFGLWYVAAMI